MSIPEDFHDFEWEERSDITPLKVHLLAGSIAGIAEHTACLPLDNMKTHVQKTGASMRQVFHTLRNFGYHHFYKGFGIISMGCVPSHALFFSSYEISKKYFTRENQIDILGNAIVGGIAVIFHDLLMSPCEMVKQRMQLLKSKSAFQVIRDVQREFGVRGLWRSFPINFVQNLPHSMTSVAANETFKTFYRNWVGEHTMLSYFLCGSLAGCVSAIITSPLDNIKTQLNCENIEHSSLRNLKEQFSKTKLTPNVKRGFFNKAVHKMACVCNPNYQDNTFVNKNMPRSFCAAKKIFMDSGMKGFFRGLSLRMFMISSSTAISWTIYEYFKKVFMNYDHMK
jgi:hypothetical protein